MLKLAVSVTRKDSDLAVALHELPRALKGAYAQIRFVDAASAGLAATHEFGVPGQTPESASIRTALALHRDEYMARLTKGIPDVIAKRTTVKALMDSIAQQMAADIRRALLDSPEPSLAGSVTAEGGP